MKVRVLQHVPFEGLGSIGPWLAARGAQVAFTRFYQSEALPGLDGIDLVIAMGGPMSVNDEEAYAWLKSEKAFIREAVRRGLPVLGVCLGAQLLASALGARVYANACKEIGWFPVQALPAAGDVFRFPAQAVVFHWHGETFDLPAGAVPLAQSAGCRNQAYQVGPNAIGLQFHLETTPESAAEIIANCRGELVAGAYIQTEEALGSAPASRYREINRLMADVLAYLTRTPRRA